MIRVRTDRHRAERALAASQRDLSEIRARKAATKNFAARLRELRRENHFGPAFVRYLGGKV